MEKASEYNQEINTQGSIYKSSIDYKSLISLLTKHDVTVTLGCQDSGGNVRVCITFLQLIRNLCVNTVLPAKSDSDVLFVYEVIRDLESIDHLCINPIHGIGLIHR